jgi:group I intron endonuclease
MENYLKNSKSHIYSALLKHGHSNFSLIILEYCEPYELLIREKYHIDFGSEYNIVKDPTLPPMSGRTHSDESKQKISDTAKKSENPGRFKKGQESPMFGQNHTEGTKNKISDALTGENHPNYGKARHEGALRIFNKKESPLNK